MVNTTVTKTANVQEDIRNVSFELFDEYDSLSGSTYYELDYNDLTANLNHTVIIRYQIPVPLLITVIVLSLIGNILVVVISVFCIRLQSLTSIFTLNLALSDLLFTVTLVSYIRDYIWRLTTSEVSCKVFNVLFSAGFYSSIVFLVLMSVQRYITVVHPHTGWKKGCWVTHVLICSWMISILAALPVAGVCTHSSKTALLATTYKDNIIFVCAFFFMAFCYIRILQTIFKSPTNQKHRTTGLTFLLVATFCICWAPYNIVMFLDTLPYYSVTSFTHLNYIIYICYLPVLSRCCLNPVIYDLFGLIFRNTAQEILQRRANFNVIEEHHNDSYVNVNNQVPKLDINHDAVLTVTTAIY